MTALLPRLTDLARVRLRANEGRYQAAILPDGRVVNANERVALSPERSFFPVRGGQSVPVEECRIVNAAMVRDNCLDIAEELADAENIAALLTRRLQTDDRLTRTLQGDLGNLRQTLVSADHYLRRIREQLRDDYCCDQIAVQRDEVTG